MSFSVRDLYELSGDQIQEVFLILLKDSYLLDIDPDHHILINLAQGVQRISSESSSLDQIAFCLKVLVGYERAMRHPRIPQTVSQEGRLLREKLVEVLTAKYLTKTYVQEESTIVNACALDILASYLTTMRSLDHTEDTYHHDAEIARLCSVAVCKGLKANRLVVPKAQLLHVLEPLNEITCDIRRESCQTSVSMSSSQLFFFRLFPQSHFSFSH